MKSFTSKVVLWWIMWRIVFVFLLKYFIRRVLNFPPLLSYVLRFCDILFHVNLMLPRKANNGLQDFFFFQSRKSRFENYIRKAIKRFLNLWRSDAICSLRGLHFFEDRAPGADYITDENSKYYLFLAKVLLLFLCSQTTAAHQQPSLKLWQNTSETWEPHHGANTILCHHFFQVRFPKSYTTIYISSYLQV